MPSFFPRPRRKSESHRPPDPGSSRIVQARRIIEQAHAPIFESSDELFLDELGLNSPVRFGTLSIGGPKGNNTHTMGDNINRTMAYQPRHPQPQRRHLEGEHKLLLSKPSNLKLRPRANSETSPHKLEISRPFDPRPLEPVKPPAPNNKSTSKLPIGRAPPSQSNGKLGLSRTTSAYALSDYLKPSHYRHRKVKSKDARPRTPEPDLLQNEHAQKVIDSSPKLQSMLFGTQSPVRRRVDNPMARLDEDALITDDEDDASVDITTMLSANISRQPSKQTTLDMDLIAPWLEAIPAPMSGPASIIDVSLAAGIKNHELNGQRTTSFYLPNPNPSAESIKIETKRPDVPLATPLPASIVARLKDEPKTKPSLALSGLLQHSNVMEFYEGPKVKPQGPRPLDDSTMVRNALRQTDPNLRGRSRTISGPFDPNLPVIKVKRASSQSKRSSTDAGLIITTPPTLKKSRLSDPAQLHNTNVDADDDGNEDIALGFDLFDDLERKYGQNHSMETNEVDQYPTTSYVGSKLGKPAPITQNRIVSTGQVTHRRLSVPNATQYVGSPRLPYANFSKPWLASHRLGMCQFDQPRDTSPSNSGHTTATTESAASRPQTPRTESAATRPQMPRWNAKASLEPAASIKPKGPRKQVMKQHGEGLNSRDALWVCDSTISSPTREALSAMDVDVI